MRRLAVALALLSGALVAPMASTVVPARAGYAGAASERLGTIAFLRQLATGTGLFTIGPDGSGLRRLTPSGVDVPSYGRAPGGRRIAYLDKQGALRLVRPDGTRRGLLARGSPLRSGWFLSWSPDGNAIAVDARAGHTASTRPSVARS